MNSFLNGLTNANNFTYTENGALTHKSTGTALLDMFGMGAAYRTRSDEDCILLFKNAFEENPSYALKCLFYLRDCRGGQGERRFWRVCMKWLANNNKDAALRNLPHVPKYGRWDDLYVFMGTPLENDALSFMKEQLALDVQCKTPSLLAKWLKSENTSSASSRKLAQRTRTYLGMTHRQYRKTLSILRQRINVLERLMSAGKWDEIEFDKIPSRAGMIYKNAFARHDLERMKSEKNVQSYSDFAKDETKSVNAKTLYPYECVESASKCYRKELHDPVRLMTNKYWDNLEDYFNKASFNALAVVDTSGSMTWHGPVYPIDVATSLGIYCAEKAKGPFAGYYVSFSRNPRLIKVEGVDFVDKVRRIREADLCENTNIEATFDMLLDTAMRNGCTQEELPENIIIISDMEFDDGCGYYGRTRDTDTLMEKIRMKWKQFGYEMPKLIYWNVQARQNNIPEDLGCGLVSYVSGMSPSIFETIMSGKTGMDLCLEKLDSERYACIN